MPRTPNHDGGRIESILALVMKLVFGEVKDINRVLYDISTKPPASIEWE